MKWGVPAYQRTSSFHKYTRAHAHIYFRKLLVRWYAGTLLTFYSLSTHSPMPTQNSTIIKISPPSIPSGVFRGSPAGLSRVSRGSTAGLPRVEGMSTPPQKGTIIKIYPTNHLPLTTNH